LSGRLPKVWVGPGPRRRIRVGGGRPILTTAVDRQVTFTTDPQTERHEFGEAPLPVAIHVVPKNLLAPVRLSTGGKSRSTNGLAHFSERSGGDPAPGWGRVLDRDGKTKKLFGA